MQIKRLSSICREASPRQNRHDIKGVDVLMHSFQFLDWSKGRVGMWVTAGVRGAVDDSEELE